MTADISGLLIALKQWKKEVSQLRKKGESLETREAKVEKARQAVLRHLENEQIQKEVEGLIEQAIAPGSFSGKDLRNMLHRCPETLISTELQTIHHMAVSRKELNLLVNTFLQGADKAQPIDNTRQLKEDFIQLSLVIPQSYKETSTLGRKRKKRRKRDLTLGMLDTAIGIGLLVGNTQLDSAVANASYILGGNALISALKNIVGQLDEQPDSEPLQNSP